MRIAPFADFLEARNEPAPARFAEIDVPNAGILFALVTQRTLFPLCLYPMT
jgi:hypothetical protein